MVGLGLLAGALAVGVLVSLGDGDASAQSRRPRHGAPARDAGSPQATWQADGGADLLRTGIDAGPRAVLPLTTASATALDAGVLSVKVADGGATTIQFGEVDIEGRLKSPSLIYFMRRVRAEFAAGDLGHRSFLREISETRKGRSFD